MAIPPLLVVLILGCIAIARCSIEWLLMDALDPGRRGMPTATPSLFTPQRGTLPIAQGNALGCTNQQYSKPWKGGTTMSSPPPCAGHGLQRRVELPLQGVEIVGGLCSQGVALGWRMLPLQGGRWMFAISFSPEH